MHYHVYEMPMAMTTGFRSRETADAHAREFKGSRVVECDRDRCARVYGLRDAAGSPTPIPEGTIYGGQGSRA